MKILKLMIVVMTVLFIADSLHAQQQINSTLLGSLAFQNGSDIVVVGEYAYVSNLSGVIIISISDYSSPRIVGFIETPGDCTSIDVNEDYLFVADGYKGIRVYDIKNPAHPKLKTIITVDSLAISDLDIAGNYLSVVSRGGEAPNDRSNFTLMDISDIENPTKVAQIEKPTGYDFLKVYATHTLIVVAELYCIRIFDATDPKNLVEVSKIDAGWAVHDLFMEGNYLYVAWSGYGFIILDLTDPSNPAKIGHYGFGTDCVCIPKGVYIEDNFAYVAVTKNGIKILDITYKWNPIQVGQNLNVKIDYGDFSEATGIFVRDRIAFIVDKTSGLFVVSNDYKTQNGIKDDQININDFKLFQNYPNPFNLTTKIQYQVAKQGLIKLKVYDILGKEVKNLVNEEKVPGNYKVEFNATELASGIYIYKLSTEYYSETKKMILIK